MTLIVTKDNLELGIFVIELEQRIEKLEEQLKNKDVVKPKETFDFMTAVKYMEEGKNVRRKEWNIHLYMNNKIENQIFIINKFLGIANHTYILLDDYLSNDWELYDE